MIEQHPEPPAAASQRPLDVPKRECPDCGSHHWIYRENRFRCATCNPNLLERKGRTAENTPAAAHSQEIESNEETGPFSQAEEEAWTQAEANELRKYVACAQQRLQAVQHYLQTTRHIVLDEIEQHTLVEQENQRFRQERAEIEEMLAITISELLEGKTTPKMIPSSLLVTEKQKRIAEEQRLDQLFGNPKLKAAQKIGIRYLERAVQRGQTHDSEGRTRVNHTTLGKQMGMSRYTGDRLIEFCKEQLPHVVDVASHDETLPDGTHVSRTYVKFINQDHIEHPDRIEPLAFKKQGGDQYECNRCHCKAVMIKRILHCIECGHEVDLEPVYPNGKKSKRSRSNVLSETHSKNTNILPFPTDQAENTSDDGENHQNEQKQPAFHDDSGNPPQSEGYSLYHIGYRSPDALEQIKQAMKQDPSLILVDIRYKAESNKPEWRREAFTAEYQSRYQWIPDLGNTPFKEPGNVSIANPEKGIAQLRSILRGHAVILMCGCPEYEKCHRKVVIELLQQADSDATNTIFYTLQRNLPHILKPLQPDTPPASCVSASLDEQQAQMRAAAELLVDLAGDAAEHIEMSRRGQKKYYTVPRSLTIEDALDHLRGGQARGGLCSWVDGTARGLCWDVDDEDGWLALQRAARLLVAAGYQVILEESPAARGGHLWIVYSVRVCVEVARCQVYEIASELASLPEYWPGPASAKKWNRVRLPGGKYVRCGKYVETAVNAWCPLISVSDGEMSRDGQSAAALLLGHQTLASMVRVVPEVVPQQRDLREDAGATLVKEHIQPADSGVRQLPKVDDVWGAKYGDVAATMYWFAVTEDRCAKWFNEHHSLEEIRPREADTKMALSPNGLERTASTDYWESSDGERYTDYSLHGRLPDGGHDTGDALQLAMKVWGRTKSSLLAQGAKEIISQARAEMEDAARAGQQPPVWVREILTPAGWRRYNHLLPAANPTIVPSVVHSERDPAPTSATVVEESDPPLLQAEEGPSATLFDLDQATLVEERPQVVPESSSLLSKIQQLDALKEYGQNHDWPAFFLENEVVIPAGREHWLQFIWLSGQKDRQRQVYAAIQARRLPE